MIRKVCKHCDSEEVFVDAYAEWDPYQRMWVLCATYQQEWCSVCDGETTIVDKVTPDEDGELI